MRRFCQTALALASIALLACARTEDSEPASAPFTIAVIPDTQNYVDYTHQRADGFALDASELFLEQMRDVARRAVGNGGDVVFVASVGDVWQHQTERIDPEHAARGFRAIDNPIFAREFKVGEEARKIEIPKAIEGYEIIAAAGLPFGVAPGNHDYDAMWSDSGFPPDLAKLKKDPAGIRMVPEDLGMFHIGGLDNFRSAFGAQTDFFRDKSWYVDHYAGGANSAQVFEAGGYRFLHIAIQMQAPDDVLEWVRGVLAKHPGMPTMLSTHDYLSTAGERHPNPIVDLERVDPDHHNSAEELWQKLIARHDQIFLVLCGHQHGQARRVDTNASGHEVHQVLADYQDRGQVGIEARQAAGYFGRPAAIGDGWYRLMTFDLAADLPLVRVTTWSSHYETASRDTATYAEWYREHERPELTDAEFHAEDDFVLELRDFRERFGPPLAD
ncbi:MAG: serine/threonine protein phosphatase [Deltaproteobacteria bacterium]|nr:serine/threonine protein phosphatase [Deltaproteobacteria bacterium]